jgi:hypothetical protein
MPPYLTQQTCHPQLHMLVMKLLDFHCDHADEHSRADLVSIIIGSQPNVDQQCIADASGPHTLELISEVQQLFTSLRSALARTNPDPWALKVYPSHPEEWKQMVPQELYNQVYSQGLPIACPINPMLLGKLKAVVPCRGSKLTTKSKEPSSVENFLQQLAGIAGGSPSQLQLQLGGRTLPTPQRQRSGPLFQQEGWGQLALVGPAPGTAPPGLLPGTLPGTPGLLPGTPAALPGAPASPAPSPSALARPLAPAPQSGERQSPSELAAQFRDPAPTPAAQVVPVQASGEREAAAAPTADLEDSPEGATLAPGLEAPPEATAMVPKPAVAPAPSMGAKELAAQCREQIQNKRQLPPAGGAAKKARQSGREASLVGIPPKPSEMPPMPEEEKPAPVLYRGAKVSLQKRKWRGGIPANLMPGLSESQRECTVQFATPQTAQTTDNPESKKRAFLQVLGKLDHKLDARAEAGASAQAQADGTSTPPRPQELAAAQAPTPKAPAQAPTPAASGAGPRQEEADSKKDGEAKAEAPARAPKPPEPPRMPEEERPLLMYRGAKVTLQKRKWRAGIPKALMPDLSESKRDIFRQFASENSTEVRSIYNNFERGVCNRGWGCGLKHRKISHSREWHRIGSATARFLYYYY